MKKKSATKIMSYLLNTAMIVGGLSLSPLATVEVRAAEKKNINLNVGNDIEGISGTSVNTNDAATIYYGKHPDNNNVESEKRGKPIPWRVIGYNGATGGVASESGKATLLAEDVVIHGPKFDNSSQYSNNYSGSNLQTQINSILGGLTAIEKSDSAVSKRTLDVCTLAGNDHDGDHDTGVDDTQHCNGITGIQVSDAVMWPLSTAEAKATNSDLRKTTGSSIWWLRSPGNNGHNAAYVNYDGNVNSNGNGVYIEDGSVRPAFHLNLSSVLFSSASGASKSSSFDSTLSGNGISSWKLTLKDESGTFLYERVDSLTSFSTDDVVRINVTEISSQYDHITAMVLDASNTVLAYGATSQGSGTGEKSFTIPAGVTGGTQIKFFAEKWNGLNETDYAREGGVSTTTSSSSHTHHFEWVITQEPTVTQDGVEEYRCSCGEVNGRNIIPASMFYVKEFNRRIMEAPQNGIVDYDAGWNSCISDYVLRKVADRPDVTIIITFEYQNKKYRLTIPAGTDVTALLQDEEQIYGYFGLAALLGLEVEEIVEIE